MNYAACVLDWLLVRCDVCAEQEIDDNEANTVGDDANANGFFNGCMGW